MESPLRVARLVSLLFALGALVVVGWQYSVTDLLSGLQETGNQWPVVILLLGVLYLVHPFFLWPLSVFSVFIGYLFGFPVGVPLVLAGTVLTCLPPFLLATRFDDDHLEWLASRGAAVFDTTGELRGMVAARLSPAPADAVSYGAGISGITTHSFVAGTLLGELPWAIFYVVLGRSLDTFSAARVREVDVGVLLLAGLASILFVAKPLYGLVRNWID